MANKMYYKVEGLEEITRTLREFGSIAGPFMRSASDKGANVVLVRAKIKVPVDSGALRDSLHVKPARWKHGDEFTSAVVTWGDDVREYAAAVELGHKTVNGKLVPETKFLRKSADETKAEVRDIIADAVNQVIDVVGRPK
jgi:hypothetical protein